MDKLGAHKMAFFTGLIWLKNWFWEYRIDRLYPQYIDFGKSWGKWISDYISSGVHRQQPLYCWLNENPWALANEGKSDILLWKLRSLAWVCVWQKSSQFLLKAKPKEAPQKQFGVFVTKQSSHPWSSTSWSISPILGKELK